MGMLTKILVAMDDSEAGRAAEAYADDLAHSFGGSVTRCRINGVEVGRRARQQLPLVAHVVDAAQAIGADVIVLGLERRRLAHHRLSPSLRERLSEAAPVPVLVPPMAAPTSELSGHAMSGRFTAVKRSLQHV